MVLPPPPPPLQDRLVQTLPHPRPPATFCTNWLASFFSWILSPYLFPLWLQWAAFRHFFIFSLNKKNYFKFIHLLKLRMSFLYFCDNLRYYCLLRSYKKGCFFSFIICIFQCRIRIWNPFWSLVLIFWDIKIMY